MKLRILSLLFGCLCVVISPCFSGVVCAKKSKNISNSETIKSDKPKEEKSKKEKLEKENLGKESQKTKSPKKTIGQRVKNAKVPLITSAVTATATPALIWGGLNLAIIVGYYGCCDIASSVGWGMFWTGVASGLVSIGSLLCAGHKICK